MFRLRQVAKSARGRSVLLIAVLPATVVIVLVATVALKVHSALHRAGISAGTLGQLAFTTQTLNLSAGHSSGSGFDPVAAKPEYTSGVFVDGALYLAGPNGLTRVDSEARAALDLRTGLDLPTAQIVAMAAGRVRGATAPELLLATAGSGLLLLEPNAQGLPVVHIVLPVERAARDLTTVLPLDTGDVLLGTRDRGLLLYDGSRLSQELLNLPGIDSAKLHITALARVDTASFLIGTRDAGVFFVSGGTVRQATTANGMPDDDVVSLAVADGQAFVGTPAGTAQFDLAAESWVPQRVLGAGMFSHALASNGRELSIGTMDQGVREIPLGQAATLRLASLETDPSQLQRVDGFLSQRGQTYALADGTLLHREAGNWSPVLPAKPSALSDRNISALAFAPDGTLYVGFFDKGLDLLSPQGTVRHLEDDHLFCINRLALDPGRHTIAAATGDGLVLFDEHGVPRQTLMHRDGLISDHVTDIAFTGSGMALATPAGITFFGASGPESLYAFQGLVNNHVYALAAVPGSSGADGLLAGTLGGLSVLQARAVRRSFTVNNSTLGHNWITALLATSPTTTLVGTYGAGLETLDAQGRFVALDLPSGTPRDLVINPNALLATPTHIYAGTLGHGILVYSQAVGRWSSLTAGLPSLNVTSFAARDGELYVGTDNGLVRIAEARLL